MTATLLSIALCSCVYIAIYAHIADMRDYKSEQRRRSNRINHGE